jgi:hypothetical protein
VVARGGDGSDLAQGGVRRSTGFFADIRMRSF